MAYSKIILNGETLMDVTSDTVAAGSLLSGKTATKNDGTKVTGNIASKTASDLTASGATVTAAAGYYSSAVSKSVAAGSAFPPAVTITKNPTIGVNASGVVTATYTGSSSITPTVTSGYVSKGTAGTVSTTGTSTYQLTSKAAATYYPSTADQTIASQRWLVGNQTIKSVTTSNLTAANIKSGTVVKVGDSANASRITQVTGTLKEGVTHTAQISGGGNSSNCYVQYNGTKYYTEGQTFTFYDGDVIYLYVNGPFESYIQFGGGKYSETESGAATYSYTAIGCNTDFNLVYDSLGDSRIEVNFINSDFTNYRPELALDYTGIENQITPTTQMQHINPSSNCYGLGQVVVKAIPDTYVQPSGTYNISSNGTYNISSYANADVNVSGGEFYSAYRDKATSNYLKASNNYVQQWFDSLTSIRNYMFAGCNIEGDAQSSVIFPNVLYMQARAFEKNSAGGGYNFTANYYFPKCSSIGVYAFTDNQNIGEINCPVCTSINSQAFLSCRKLISISFPQCQSINYSAFSGCTSLTTAIFPSCTQIRQNAFNECTSLSIASFPMCQRIDYSAFCGCYSLITINFPTCTYLDNQVFSNCRRMPSINMPLCSIISSYCFQDCTTLSIASFPVCTNISTGAFYNCRNLISLYLNSVSAVPTLGNSAFYSTPIGGYSTSAGRYGSIFVPASLYSSFLTAAGWSIYSSRIVSV